MGRTQEPHTAMFSLIAQLFKRTMLVFIPNLKSSTNPAQYASTISGGDELHKNAGPLQAAGGNMQVMTLPSSPWTSRATAPAAPPIESLASLCCDSSRV